MHQRSYTEFYLEDLSSSWLRSKWAQYLYRLYCLIVGFVIGAIFGLVSGMLLGPVVDLIVGTIAGLTLGIAFGLQELQPAERLPLSWRYILASIGVGLIFGPSFFALVFGLFFGLSDTVPAAIIDRSLCKKPNQGIWQSRENAFRMGICFALIFGLVLGPIFGPIFGPALTLSS